jgi:acetyl esterase/lipase
MALIFDENKYTIRTMEAEGQSVTFRAFENLVCVEHPVDPAYQAVSIYVPECFYHGERIGGYDLHTAPILFENNVGGFFPSELRPPEHEMFGHTSTAFFALLHGYVVAIPAARGRTNRTQDGRFYGKAPAGMADLKAAARYLWANGARIPGDVRKMFSVGTSAGGGLSALMGAYDCDGDYEPLLKELGAAEVEARFLGICCYCPVTDLEHADAAYEWQFRGIYDYHRRHMRKDEGGRPHFSQEDGELTPRQVELSEELAQAFPAYLNSLELTAPDGSPLCLDENGLGSFRDYITGKIAQAAQKALDRGEAIAQSGVTVEDGKTAVDFQAFMKGITRMKEAPAFDDVTMHSFENNLFGDEHTDNMHFTPFSLERSTSDAPKLADPTVLRMVNPLSYMKAGSALAGHWRFRMGTADRDVGFATPAILALTLEKLGCQVDYALVWNQPHGGDFDLPELFQWIDTVVRTEETA